MSEWFEQWFGEEYLRLYPHRDDEDAERLVTLIDARVPLAARRVLDLACGPGRHAAQFARRGASVVGFDLSMPLLSRARHRPEPVVDLVRGDMRQLPFRSASFDLVVNLFTSFGYFADDVQHAQVLCEAADALRPGGAFVLDYLNAGFVRDTLVLHEEREVGERRVAVGRRISADDRFVIKEMHLVDDGRSFVERVRLFTREELESMVEAAGLAVRTRLGDYKGGAVSPSAPRVILLAERT